MEVQCSPWETPWGWGCNIANCLVMFVLFYCHLFCNWACGSSWGSWESGRDRAGCRALGKGRGSPNCSLHPVSLVSSYFVIVMLCFCCHVAVSCHGSDNTICFISWIGMASLNATHPLFLWRHIKAKSSLTFLL